MAFKARVEKGKGSHDRQFLAVALRQPSENMGTNDSTWNLPQMWQHQSLIEELHFISAAARTLPKLWPGWTREGQLPPLPCQGRSTPQFLSLHEKSHESSGLGS